MRFPQKPDFPNDVLTEDGRNLALVLNRLSRSLEIRQRFLEALRNLYSGLSDFHVNIEYGTVQVFIQEGKVSIPATRLSDGTLRYLCLLAVSLRPESAASRVHRGAGAGPAPGCPAGSCGAAARCFRAVSTDRDDPTPTTLVDALTDTPESVVVCEKHDGRTRMKRLNGDDLLTWLERYRLGEFWASGGIGGNRW